MDLEIDLHKNSERQGPGSEKETLQALGFMNLPSDQNLKIADIGCGSGGQTITLAQHTNGLITAVDLVPDFLEELNQKSKMAGVGEKIKTLEASMENLPFEKGYFDIIWSEGAIYNIGFEKGIQKWSEFLKPKGYLSISEITWISHTRPREIEDFWRRECPEITTAANNIKILEDNGYILLGYFHLEETSWIKNYYEPIKSQFSSFLLRNGNSELAGNLVKQYKEEIAMYERFKPYYSYGFYIAQKST